MEQYKKIFEEFLNKNLPKVAPKELYEPYHYIMNLDAKRVRPALMMMAMECFKPLDEDVMNSALAIELFHNFSLMHDDIMDHSDTRRGLPTVHKKFGENSAILSGDVMLILSYQLLEKLKNAEHFKEIYHMYNHTAVQICSGQQLDMNFEKDIEVSEMEYLMMIEYKTAVLLASSMKIGAILADASQLDKSSFYNYGLNVGMAFQIQDDLLDVFGNEEKIGKTIGKDIINNKKTILYIKALQMAHPTQRQILLNWSQTREFNQDKIDDVTKIYQESGAKNYAIQLRNQYHQKALDNIQTMSIKDDKKMELTNFANQIVDRIK